MRNYVYIVSLKDRFEFLISNEQIISMLVFLLSPTNNV